KSPDDEAGLFLAREISRRWLVIAAGAAAAGSAIPPLSTLARQSAGTATPAADQQRVDALLALSQELCGGGTFDATGASELLGFLSGDADLAQGLADLQAMPLVQDQATSWGRAK
ncbi:MAG: hypothetical protein ACJ8H8_30515, partial [Geminicoccaceae bacterium]